MKQWLSSQYFYTASGRLIPWLAVLTIVTMGYGISAALYFTPIDYQQQHAVRLMYIHVPCALLSLSIYAVIGGASALYLIFKIKIMDSIAKVSAPIGASITALTLFTGMLWGKPMWGTWWVWDARLTSELILLFLYFGYIGLRSAIRNRQQAATLCAILAVVGLIDIPIIHYSVEWWHTLHQGASISKLAKPSIATPMLVPLLVMICACYLFYGLLVLVNVRTDILSRERNAAWVKTSK